jgi:hypothetical protein
MVPLPSDTPSVGGLQWPRPAPQNPSEIAVASREHPRRLLFEGKVASCASPMEVH